MSLFKKKGWELVTLKQFQDIEKICNSESQTKDLEIMRVIYGDEKGDIQFLQDKPEVIKYKKSYTLNGKEYILQADISKLNTSQYIDFINSKNMTEYLSVLLIPEKHNYNDGYDMDEVKEDILTLNILDCNAITNFLLRQSKLFTVILVDYLKSSPSMLPMMKNMTDEQKKTFSVNMELYLSFIQSVMDSI